ncbi:hypothetical protein [Halomarina rubra]|uniref:Cox cluster protein n=1 Tax=Halomarina rubra TaxID=2071873 RepID=A0ABD6AZF3_9EURY|nr:hypothetical protein [Halomarina rubra]
MTTAETTTSGPSVGVLDVFAIVAGALVFAYGLLLVSASPLGGGWVAAIGLSLALAGLFATEWSGERFGISPATRRTLSVSFAALAAAMFVSFVVVNYTGFSGPETVSGTESGSD